MTLHTLQQDLTAVCLTESPEAERLQRLGEQDRFRLYRRMVRRRLAEEFRKTFKRTVAVIGDEVFEGMFTQYMAEHGPRTRFFHQLPVEFARVMLPSLRAAQGIPPHAADLLHLEAARREVANLEGMPAADQASLCEFNFDQPVVLQPTLRLLDLQYPVQELERGAESCQSRPTFLALFRPHDDARVRHFALNPVTFDLLRLLAQRPTAMKDAVAQVGQTRGTVIDEAFLSGLCTVLADFIEARLVLGCSPNGGN